MRPPMMPEVSKKIRLKANPTSLLGLEDDMTYRRLYGLIKIRFLKVLRQASSGTPLPVQDDYAPDESANSSALLLVSQKMAMDVSAVKPKFHCHAPRNSAHSPCQTRVTSKKVVNRLVAIPSC